MTIWDLRRGDADDDRLSPGGRGLRAIVLSTLFELNILQASIAFLLLVLVPAFVVGLMPSVAFTYGAVLNDAASRLGDEFYRALAILLICAAAAYVWGASMVRWTLRDIWQLNYTLVFPIFVFARECIKLVGEKLLGVRASAAALHHRRRICTMIAGALFAGGSLLLTAVLLRKYGIVSVSLTAAPPLDIIRAVLIDGLIVLALSTAGTSVFWAWRELSEKSPVIDSFPSPAPTTRNSIRIAHISDPHVVGGPNEFRMEPGTRGPRGNARLSAVFSRLTELDSEKRLDWILITGDITDAGTRPEWIEFLDHIALHPQISDRVLIVPGNHDVNIADRSDAARLELPWSVSKALRKLRFLVAADGLQGRSAYVIDRDTGKLGPTLDHFLRSKERQKHMQNLASSGSLRAVRRASQIWHDVFPLVVPPASGRPGVILLNSSTDSHMALTNAIGVIDPQQLQALALLLKTFEGATWLIALHHQVVEYPTPGVSLKERVALSLINAPDLIAIIRDYAGRILIFHGHRHRDWIGRCGKLGLCSAPSATLGGFDEHYARGVFHIHDVSTNAEGDLRIQSTERITIS